MTTTLIKQGTLLEQRLGNEAPTRRPTRAQLRLARQFDIDIAKFERGFRRDILKVLEDMGRELERIVLEVLGEQKDREIMPGIIISHPDLKEQIIYEKRLEFKISLLDIMNKDSGQDAMDSAIISESLISAGFVGAMETVYKDNYALIMQATQTRIDASLQLGFFTNEAEAKLLAEGAKRVELLNLVGNNTTRDIFAQLAEGRADGESVAQLARRIRDSISSGRFNKVSTRATLIARTETTKAQQFAAVENYKQGGVTEVLIMDARLGNTDEECMNLNGSVVSLAEGNQLMSDEHPNGTRRLVALPPPILEGL